MYQPRAVYMRSCYIQQQYHAFINNDMAWQSKCKLTKIYSNRHDSTHKLHMNFPNNTLESPYDATTPPVMLTLWSGNRIPVLAMYRTGKQSTCAAACSVYMYIPLCGQHRYELPYKSYIYICTGAPGVSLHAYLECRLKLIIQSGHINSSMVINHCFPVVEMHKFMLHLFLLNISRVFNWNLFER